MWLGEIAEVLQESLMITFFVIIMMSVVEWLNILTRGRWQVLFCRYRGVFQYLLAVLLGLTPGCLGSFVAISLYVHRIFSLGAVVATMIATSGDEAFIMFAMIPTRVPVLMLILTVTGFVSGLMVDILFSKRIGGISTGCEDMVLHHDELSEALFHRVTPGTYAREFSVFRAVLLITCISFIIFLLTGKIGPEEWNWEKLIFLISSLIGLILFLISSNHFLEEHLYQHIIRSHLLTLFLWTFSALFLIKIITLHVNFQNWISDNELSMLFLAGTIGILPISGPHILFVSLLAKGLIPFSILIANSIVQDGHGMLPLLAFSRREFFLVKAINLLVGLMVGALLLLVGW